MGLTSALFTGLSGLNTNQLRLDTVGDNIANVNTTAFKSNRVNFESQFAVTLSGGTAPGENTGGTNPSQVGRGALLGSVQRSFTPGSVETTGVPTDMAVEGAGFFIVDNAGEQMYTRDGSFKLNADNVLVTGDGSRVQGFGVDNNFNIIPGILKDVEIPLGTLSTAGSTTNALFDGNLNSNGPVATQGSLLFSQVFETGPGTPATGSALLTDLYDPAASAVNPLFVDGDVITVSGAKKGGRELPDRTFNVTATSTLDEFTTFLNGALGINQDAALAPATPGITVSALDPPPPGTIVVSGNFGEDNDIEIPAAAIRSTNANFPAPFTFNQQQAATGQSIYTTFQAFDSLGNPISVNVAMTLESKSTTGNTWRFYADSPDDTDPNSSLGATGTLTFDTDGKLLTATGNSIQVNRANTGALDPVGITLDFSKVTGLTTQTSTLVMTNQDGFPTGTLTSFSVGQDGIINGTFTNGLSRTLGQMALATFTNPEGLVFTLNNLYQVGANSGQPVITAAQTFGAGRILAARTRTK